MFDLTVFNKQTYAVMVETIAQHVNLFNEQSQGTIQLQAKPFQGDFDIEASFNQIAGLVRHRDVKNGQNAIDSKRLEQHTNAAVKIAAGTPELLWESAQFRWVQQDQEQAALVIGEQLGLGQIANMLNSAIKCGVSAIGGNSEATLDGTDKAIDFAQMTRAAQKFGDRSGSIESWVMHSGALTNLYLNTLANNEQLFSFDNVAVYRDQFGRLFVVTDAPDLVYANEAGDGVLYNTMGLSEGGLIISTQDDFDSTIETKTGTENITRAYQAEWSYAASVKGYTWDMAAGGDNPNATALATGTNWKTTAASVKIPQVSCCALSN